MKTEPRPYLQQQSKKPSTNPCNTGSNFSSASDLGEARRGSPSKRWNPAVELAPGTPRQWLPSGSCSPHFPHCSAFPLLC